MKSLDVVINTIQVQVLSFIYLQQSLNLLLAWLANSKELIAASQTVHRICNLDNFLQQKIKHYIQLQHVDLSAAACFVAKPFLKPESRVN